MKRTLPNVVERRLARPSDFVDKPVAPFRDGSNDPDQRPVRDSVADVEVCFAGELVVAWDFTHGGMIAGAMQENAPPLLSPAQVLNRFVLLQALIADEHRGDDE